MSETWMAILLMMGLGLAGSCAWLWIRTAHLRTRLHEVGAALEARSTDLERARLHIQRLTPEDDLTSLANHEQLLESLQREWRRARREMSPLSLLVADVDDFRAFNRQYGRPAGDDCLKRIGEALSGLVGRPGDLVSRYHRDQFAIALGGTDGPGAQTIAERVRRTVEEMAVPAAEGAASHVVTVSVGLSTIVPPRDSALEELDLMKAARHALRHARETGGNRVSQSVAVDPAMSMPNKSHGNREVRLVNELNELNE